MELSKIRIIRPTRFIVELFMPHGGPTANDLEQSGNVNEANGMKHAKASNVSVQRFVRRGITAA